MSEDPNGGCGLAIVLAILSIALVVSVIVLLAFALGILK